HLVLLFFSQLHEHAENRTNRAQRARAGKKNGPVGEKTHPPPYPIPARRKSEPIRPSLPMPLHTSSMSAPTDSQKFATALINEILSARKALDECLINSALRGEVSMYIGRERDRSGLGTALPFCA